MTLETLREARDQKPFKAFTVVAADGTRYAVKHPEMLFIPHKSSRTFALAEGNRFAVLDLLLMTALEYHSRAPAAGGSNGHSPRHR
jgi:hypothetical protein